MKLRLSYFLISGIILFSFFAGLFIWRNNHLKNIHDFKKKSLTAPMSSKYIPINSDLVFHWNINPTIFPNYIANYQGKTNKNITKKNINLIRDSLFKLIGLDFKNDISKWAGEHGSFAIFEANNQYLNNWLMVLEIKKNIDINEELEMISEQIISDEKIYIDNNSNISIPKQFAKTINSDQTIYFAQEKEYILVSSNPKIIKDSIIKAESNILNTKENYKNIMLKENINDGILFLEISPRRIFKLVTKKEDLFEINQTDKLISSIGIGNKKIIIDGILSFNNKDKRGINEQSRDSSEIINELNIFDNFVFIDNPKEYFNNNSMHSYKKLISLLIKKSISDDYSNLFKLILENTNDNLIWLKNKNWLALTGKVNTGKTIISQQLTKDKFLKSDLDFENKNLEVWSKITASKSNEYELKDSIEVIVEENESTYTWSQDLTSISKFDNKKYLPFYLSSENKKDEENKFDNIIMIHLGKEKTELFLNNFYPYILFKAMLGNKLGPPNSIDISISIPTINYPDFIKYNINLITS